MSENKYYRILVNKLGIYKVLDKIDFDHTKRIKGPDDNWYPHIQSEKYPGCIFWWTDLGFEKYKQSGLFNFHKNLINFDFDIEIAVSPKNLEYEDEYQIALKKNNIEIIKTIKA